MIEPGAPRFPEPQGAPSARAAPALPRLVVMGVSGSGKSTVGRVLAHRLGVEFVEGDDLHPPRNVALMASGTPLTDDDRRGWLSSLAQRLRDAHERGRGLVVSCSALKRSYRDQLRAGSPDVRFVHLSGTPELLADRVRARSGHYMPASLLRSQLDTLEPPTPDEAAICIDIAGTADGLASQVLDQLAAMSR